MNVGSFYFEVRIFLTLLLKNVFYFLDFWRKNQA